MTTHLSLATQLDKQAQFNFYKTYFSSSSVDFQHDDEMTPFITNYKAFANAIDLDDYVASLKAILNEIS
jgi:hypothetical protein